MTAMASAADYGLHHTAGGGPPGTPAGYAGWGVTPGGGGPCQSRAWLSPSTSRWVLS
jgi:hypothetical protein